MWYAHALSAPPYHDYAHALEEVPLLATTGDNLPASKMFGTAVRQVEKG